MACQAPDSEEPSRLPGPLAKPAQTQQLAGSSGSKKTGREAAPATPEGRNEGGRDEQAPTWSTATPVTTSSGLCRDHRTPPRPTDQFPGQGARRRRTWKRDGKAAKATTRDVDERAHWDIDEVEQQQPARLRADADGAESTQNGETGPDRVNELRRAR